MGKYNLKKQTGAISVFVMMAMLFFLLTILGIYLISTKRAQAQTEAFRMARERYYSEDAASIYNDKMANLEPNGKIPIYTKEQLWSIGEPKKIEIEGKVYDFSEPDSSNKYELKNDIIINIPESEPLEIFNGNIEMNGYEIYYFYGGNYYIPANGATPILSKGGNDFIYKDNLNQTLGYVTDGLLLHYDAIQNTGTGHDSNATTWKDLSGNGRDGTLIGFNHTQASGWKENSLTFDGLDDYLSDITISDSEELTFQVVMKNDTTSEYRNIYDKYNAQVPMLWLNPNSKFEFSINYTLKQDYSNQTISVTNAMTKTVSNMFVNHQKVMNNFNHSKELNGTYQLFNRVGKQTYKGEIYSVRIYKRCLTDEEIKQNYEIDKKRFKIEETGYVTDGLVLHYDGINNTGTGHASNATTWKDLSGNGNDGILNGATWEESSLNFDGINDFVNVNESDTISPQNQTIEVVLKCNGPSKETSADKRQIFFVKWVGYTMELNADNTISYGRSDATAYLQSQNRLHYGTMMNITATNGDNVSTLYFNNTQENQTQTIPAAYSSMNNISIGNYSNGRHFNGNIYAIRMYDRVLTEAERAKNYEMDKQRFKIDETGYVTDRLVLHYDGINNTGTGHVSNATTWKDLSGNGNDGILNGFNYTQESGWKTNGLKFDGVDDIVKTNEKFDFSTLKAGIPFSYGATVSVKDVSQSWYGIITNMTAWGQGGFNIQYGAAQRIALGMGQYLNSTTVPTANTTYQIYGVYDGSVINLYVNGKLENSMTYNIGAGSKAMTLGYFYDDPSLPMNGDILNVKIYNKALTSEEIKTNYEIDKTRFNIQ